ncbi:MAG TPA: cytochrome b [Gammaproteobacteria bacterium]|nr:cytochrome b [Gammaproteobacteria bacterium]
MFSNTSTTYGSVAKFFHWLVFILLLCMITFGYFLDDVPEDYKGIAYNTHKLTGLTILSLMLLRACWALMNPKPKLPASDPLWQRLGARIVHLLLYVVVIAMPLAGWVGSSAAGRSPHLGDFKLDLPVAQSKALVDTAFNIHGYLAITIIILGSLHILAAFYHHFIEKDNILRRMLPYGG